MAISCREGLWAILHVRAFTSIENVWTSKMHWCTRCLDKNTFCSCLLVMNFIRIDFVIYLNVRTFLFQMRFFRGKVAKMLFFAQFCFNMAV